ncbi:hypothetical protein HYZ76_02515 [Candidatus Falkowbacteria bacterium]|nr:hypothetical protein [Candidatus Falkowbacteria bacterium]
MPKRTIALMSIFVVIAFGGSVFMFFYQDYIGQLVKEYIAKITICGNITDEDVCYEKDFCEGVYGPPAPGSNEIEFKNCQNIPVETFIVKQKSKILCENTNGQWYTNKLGDFCICQKAGVNKKFDRDRGCLSQ